MEAKISSITKKSPTKTPVKMNKSSESYLFSLCVRDTVLTLLEYFAPEILLKLLSLCPRCVPGVGGQGGSDPAELGVSEGSQERGAVSGRARRRHRPHGQERTHAAGPRRLLRRRRHCE